MAKKKKIEETEEYFPIQVPPTPTPIVKDEDFDLRYKVLHFRGKGFDNNRIAALLGIQKSIVDGIK